MSGPTTLDFVKGISPLLLWGGFVVLCIGSFVYGRKKNVSVTDTFQIWYWPYVFVVPLIAVSYYAWKDPGVSFRWPQSNVLLVILMYFPLLGATLTVTALPALIFYFVSKKFDVKYVAKQKNL